MSYYGSTSLFRTYSKLTTSDISDSDVVYLLKIASRRVLEDITVYRKLEDLTGTIDGSNKTFRTKSKPIADNNYDKTVDKNDVTVYGYDEDTYGNISLTTLTVNSINADLGQVTLETAPNATDYDKLVISYRYWNIYNQSIDWSLIDIATTYYACYLAYITEKGLLPITYRLGSLAVTWGRGRDDLRPHIQFLRLYESTIIQIRGIPIGV